jgi:hypothetical protein
MRWLYALAALGLALGGCRETLPAYTVAVPPRLVDERPPPSVVFARARVPLEGLDRALTNALPPTLEGETKRGAWSVRWSFSRRAPSVRGDPHGLRVDVSEVGTLEVHAGPISCRSTEAGFDIVAVARPALAADGALELADVRLLPTPLAPLECNGLRVPLGAILEELTRPLGAQLASALEHLRLPLGGLADQALDELAAPRPLEVAGAPACLTLDPHALVLAPVAGEGSSLALAVGAEVAPRATLAPCGPAAPRPRADVKVREAALGESFAVDVLLAVPFAELQRRVADALVGRRFGETRQVVVRGVTVGDASGRLLVKLDVQGAIDGALYLWGTPTVVARDGRFFVEVPDLRVATETESLTTRLGLWLWKQRGGGLEALVKQRSSFDVTGRIEEVRRAASRTFRPSVSPFSLVVGVDRVEPGPVRSQPGELGAHLRLVGHATLER